MSKLSSLLSDCYSMCLKNDCLGAACRHIDPADPAASESEEVQTQRGKKETTQSIIEGTVDAGPRP